MQAFTQHQGVAAPLLRINVDTDAIIPSREMKSVSKKGLSGGLFAGWRYIAANGREPDPQFILNQPAYSDTSILLSGANFGCGSSREHAVWALAEYGIRSIIAPSFGSIFYNNCMRNGVLPVVLQETAVRSLAEQVQVDPQKRRLHIDLQAQTVTAPDGHQHGFETESGHRHMLLQGLDAIGLTLQQQDKIDQHIARDRQQRPWAYSSPAVAR